MSETRRWYRCPDCGRLESSPPSVDRPVSCRNPSKPCESVAVVPLVEYDALRRGPWVRTNERVPVIPVGQWAWHGVARWTETIQGSYAGKDTWWIGNRLADNPPDYWLDETLCPWGTP